MNLILEMTIGVHTTYGLSENPNPLTVLTVRF